ncbi:outer membrane beta-barrel family protein [Pedobacter deserti]|uniref:outer membrane beta-barrel family protein n=1 Tax=Pedobacter deserti TaxID=2817382 RepID=UPI00210D0952|nr:outer membrane beta-barrel family protein [Pedobacter sp. SYSU D00382]
MKKLTLMLSIWCVAFCTYGQGPYAVKGQITDTAATYQMVNTTITLLRQKDSTLVRYTRADDQSRFNISGLTAGNYILLVTYPGYADYSEMFRLDSAQQQKDFGKINLILKATLLNDVIIKGRAVAIRIKGDTTEFNAGSYDIRPNDKVEDLLRQLPGIQVDKDGKITAHGQTVQKVLLDGEEFFGDDPTLVTRNIRSDMIDKVQLYDKKSDQATFTGIEDGEKQKTINLTLKEDKKKGHFGTLAAGAGTDNFYEAQGTASFFKQNQRFALIAGSGNTGQNNIGNRFSGAGAVEVSGDGGIMSSGDDFENFNGGYNGQGIPTNHVGGVHFEKSWNENKRSLNSNAKIGSTGLRGNTNTRSVNTLPTGLINTVSSQDFDNLSLKESIDGRYKHQFDSTSTITVTISGGMADSKTRNTFNTISSRADNTPINTGFRSLDNDGEDKSLNASAFWAKRLKKKGRTLSVNVKQSLSDHQTDGYLNSTNQFFDSTGVLSSAQQVNQYKRNLSTRSAFNSNVTFAEALSPSLAIVANYGFNINNSNSDRRSFNQSDANRYDILDSVFSNHFELNEYSNQGGASVSYNKGKSGLTAGTRISAVRFNQHDYYTGDTYKRDFVNWFPQLNYQYKISQQGRLTLNYNGNTSQPQPEQIQPFRENTDPLNVILGNPGLRPSFSNNVMLSYSSFKMLTEQYIHVYASYNNTFNSITNNTVTDPVSGASTNQAVNISNKNPNGLTIQAALNRKIKSLDAMGGIEFTFMNFNSYGMINNVLNENKFLDIYGNVNLAKYNSRSYSFRASVGPAYTVLSSSLGNTRSANWGIDATGNFSVNLPGKFEIRSDAVYAYKTKTEAFDQNLNRFNWNASISKKFFKTENLRFTVRGNDLLNQNKGFNQSINGNLIVQNRFTNINRYFLGSIIWDFNKMGSNKN